MAGAGRQARGVGTGRRESRREHRGGTWRRCRRQAASLPSVAAPASGGGGEARRWRGAAAARRGGGKARRWRGARRRPGWSGFARTLRHREGGDVGVREDVDGGQHARGGPRLCAALIAAAIAAALTASLEGDRAAVGASGRGAAAAAGRRGQRTAPLRMERRSEHRGAGQAGRGGERAEPRLCDLGALRRPRRCERVR